MKAPDDMFFSSYCKLQANYTNIWHTNISSFRITLSFREKSVDLDIRGKRDFKIWTNDDIL